MRRTLGYHVVKTTYGQWLPGDDRGHWSDAWDEQIGFIEPHMLHPGDPIRRRMAEERMGHPAVWLTESMMAVIMCAVGGCVERSQGGLSIASAAIENTHVHLLIPYSGRDIHRTVKWIADQATKAVHRETDHRGPVWCKGKWCSFVYDRSHWRNAVAYIERHNLRRGRNPRPWAFLCEAFV